MAGAGIFLDAELLLAPLAGGTPALTAGNGAAGNAVDLTAYRDKFVAIRFAGKTHIRFGATATDAQAVTTTDLYLTADELQVFKVIENRYFVAGYGVGGAHAGVYVAVSR